ncbi:MAG TPA: substrate-binding domain-containing protein [Acidobacteriaceae bacterium]|jgi:ribose transport system substrate-binding protein|nr:substrate-binding domain-containing protein [Acidobacteriaceae bacterium]
MKLKPFAPNSAPQRSYKVEAVARACDILATFSSSSEVLDLKVITERSQLNKVTVFRILGTLVEKGLIDRAGPRSYRSRLQPLNVKRFRVGYAAQSSIVPFTSAVTDSLVEAAYAANVDLVVLNNNYSPTVALRNADKFLDEGVDLVIESQISSKVAAHLTAKFSAANVPFIAIDIPHPGAVYFGADNYKAGKIAGQYLGMWASKHWKGAVDQIIFAEFDAAGHTLDARLTGIYDGILKLLPQCRHVPVFHYGTKAHFENTLHILRKHIRLHAAHRVLVGAVNDPSALGALQAFRELGIENTCAVAGQGACLEARDELRRRETRFICSAAYFPENYGSQIIRLALDILNGRHVPPAIFTSHELVTPANVDKIYPNDILLKTRFLHAAVH